MNTQETGASWIVIRGELQPGAVRLTGDGLRNAHVEEDELEIRGQHGQPLTGPDLAIPMSTRTKVDGRRPHKIHVKWESLDVNWKSVEIKHVSCLNRPITCLRRAWHKVVSTLRT